MAAAVFFDTETTGLPIWKGGAGHPLQPHIVQIAAILQDLETRKVLHTMALLVKIREGVTIEPKAQEVHGKTPDILSRYGYEPKTAFRMFNALLERAEVVVAHNLNFDALVYEAEVCRNEFLSMESFRKCRAYCTMLNSTMICRIPSPARPGTFKWPTLEEAWTHFIGNPTGKKWEPSAAHDALFDVERCREIYWAIEDKVNR